MFDRTLGHTLLELIAVLAIVSTLILVSIPLFTGYTEQGKIDNLKANLLKAAAAQEKHYATSGLYATSEFVLTSYGFPQDINEKMKLFTGAILIDGLGMTYWVAGNYDINPDVSYTYNECWIYFGPVLGTGNADNFMRLHDETKNITADPTDCPLSDKLHGICDLDSICK